MSHFMFRFSPGFAGVVTTLCVLICLIVVAASGPGHAQTRVIEVEASGAPQAPAGQQPDRAPVVSANVGNPTSQGPEQRVALVIGNSAYEHATPLQNPSNDAKEVSKLLTAAGFEVTSGTDLDHAEMIQVIQDFAGKVSQRGPDTVAFVYYAGHGVQIAGDNYLVPVDAKIVNDASVESAAIRLVDLMATLESVPSRMRIVILDACRNNPFDALREGGKGLAIVDAPNGSIVGYSTAPGTEAFDGSGKNSPYTAAFLRLARQPNVPIEQFFKRVRLLVNDATDGRQTPWESSSLTSDFYFFGDTQAAAKAVPQKASYPVAQLRSRPPREAYDLVVLEDSVIYYEEFVKLYPADPLCGHIKGLLAAKLMSIAWYKAILANSPVAYQSFYSKYSSSPYAQAALQLQKAPKPQPLYQPTHIIVPPKLVPQVKLTVLPVPALKLGQPNQSQQQNQQQTLNTPPNVLLKPPPGKSLLQINPSNNKPITILSDGKAKDADAKTTPNIVTPRPNPDSRIVKLSNGGEIKIGPRTDRIVDVPPRKIETLQPRPLPQVNNPGRFDRRDIDASKRFRPGLRVSDGGRPVADPRGKPALQFRGPGTQPFAQRRFQNER